MRIGLIPNDQKDNELKITKKIAGQIVSLGGTPVIVPKYREFFTYEDKVTVKDDYSSCELLICLGGDGTFITAVHDNLDLDIPLIGVNMGSVGFLAEIKPGETLDALKKIFAGEYKKEKRIMLESTCYSDKGEKKINVFSLNDVVISRGGASRILNIKLYIDDVLIEKIPGDGVIISTPTGSTAYSLSAGGPIIQPFLETILITPLNPHTLHNRCYVVSSESNIRVVIGKYPYRPSITSDGENILLLNEGDSIEIKKSQKYMTLIKIKDSNFYESLTTKIYSRGFNIKEGENDD